MLLSNLMLFALGFLLIWRGAGLIVSSASKFSRKLKLSPFAFSFVFLGILTSTPEFSVGLQAVADHTPAIFVGNLLGGVIVLFLLVIPLLAVFGNGINIQKELGNNMMLAALAVILLPAFLILDNRITNGEGVLMIVAYLVLLYLVQRRHGIFDPENKNLLDIESYSYRDLIRIVMGIGLTFIASNLIVDKTVYFAELLHIPAFYFGLLVIAVGTDLPELTLAIRSALSNKKDIAMGDYIGAAAVSTFMFGLFSLLHHGEVIAGASFIPTFGFMATALGLYYYFFRKNGAITRRGGLAMLVLYVSFFVLEAFRA